jgi:epoxyqueuosine reductase
MGNMTDSDPSFKDPASARLALQKLAAKHKFHAVRFCEVGVAPFADRFQAWLDDGMNADMDWLARNVVHRTLPTSYFPEARSVMVLSVNHHFARPPDPGGRTGLVARYAWGRDYHNLVGKRVKKLRAELRDHGIKTWGGVDNAPILERAWAHLSGMGFTGKNAMQIWPGNGSYFFLGVIFVGVAVAPDVPLKDFCGKCRRCLDSCPTDAFVGVRQVDARRCISYWTIEARELAPEPLRAGFGRWVFGCDVCQEVCPHTTNPPDPDEDDLRPRHAWIDLDELLLTSDEDVALRFSGTPLARPGPAGLKRNALVAMANLGDRDGLPAVEANLRHPEPVVREAAAWAHRQLQGA